MKTILVVDDELDTVDVLEMLLGMEGFDTLKAYDGREGLQLAESESPDLVITDLMMPRMNGLDMVRRLKSREPTRAIPVIMLSASQEPQDEADRPYTTFIQKPVDARRLLAAVQSLLGAA